MPRKENMLIMTVGISPDAETTDEFAHRILFSIEVNNPSKIIFFGSSQSRETINSVEKQYLNEFGEEFDFYEFIQIDTINSFNDYFQAIKKKIFESESDYDIIIDYSTGTKTMAIAAAFSSLLFKKKLIYINGERSNGMILKGTEEINSQNLYLVYDDLIIEKINELFNSNRFETGKELLNTITPIHNYKEIYTKLFNSYHAFDNVNYEHALENFDIKSFTKQWPENAKQFQKNMKALSILNTPDHGERNYYVLASMLNNARRRYEEHKYDDAIARLYRSLELIAQIKLNEYDIDSSDVKLELINGLVSNDYLNHLENLKEPDSGKIRLGLVQDYLLLYELDDALGKFYIDNERKIQNAIKYRNNSILAHGFDSQEETHYIEFNDITLKAAGVLRKNISRFIKETIFPNFEY